MTPRYSGSHGLRAALLWLVYAAPLLILAFGARDTLHHGWRVATFPYQIDYGEAPELNRALLMTRGEPIYVDWSQPPYQMANYTPLYPAVVSLAVRFTGPDFLPGRLLSFLSVLTSAGLLGLTAWSLGARGPAVALAGSLWLIGHPVWNWGAYQRVDSFAVVLELLGVALFCLGWVGRQRAWGVWLSVLVFVAAAYARQTVAAGAFACYGYLLFRRPRRALAAIAAYTVLGVALFALAIVLTSGSFWQHIVEGNLNRWTWATFLHYARPLWDFQYWAAALAGVGLLLAALGRRSQLPLLYLAASAATALTVGKVGSNVNYLLQVWAAVALCVGLTIGEISRLAARFRLAGALHLAVSGWLVFGAWHVHQRRQTDPWIYLADPSAGDRESARQAHAHVARVAGDVLSEDMAFTVTTGKRIYLQPFEFTQLAEQGEWDQRALLADVAARRFGAVVLRFSLAEDPTWHAQRINRPLIEAIHAAYEHEATYGDYFIYRPRT